MGWLRLWLGLSLGDQHGRNRSRYSERVYGLRRPGRLLDELASERNLGLVPASLCRGVDRQFDLDLGFGGNAVAITRMSHGPTQLFQR